MAYNPNRNDSHPCFLKVWRAKDDWDKFECGRHLMVRSHGVGTITITDVANSIEVELPRDGQLVFHEDEHGTTIDTIRPLKPTKRETELSRAKVRKVG